MSCSSVSTGISTAAERAVGIPYFCWCGSSVFPFTSKSDKNPYRRFFRCGHAADKKLQNDPHVFKWVEDAFQTEIEALHEKNKKFEETVKTLSARMEHQESIVRMRVDIEVAEKVQNVLEGAKCVMEDAKWKMKMGILGGIIGSIVVSVVMKYVG